MSRNLFICVLFAVTLAAVTATAAPPPFAFPVRFAAHVSIQTKDVQVLGNMFADWGSVQQQKHILEYSIINGTQVQLAQTTLWSNTTSGCRWERDLYDLLCVGAFICTCGPVANYPSVPQYPVGLNPTNGGYVNFNGQRCVVYLNSSTSIAYLVNAVNGGPVAVIAAWNTNDQTVYEFLRWGDTFSDASLHHRCINVDDRRGNTITDATDATATLPSIGLPVVSDAGSRFAEDTFLQAMKRFNW